MVLPLFMVSGCLTWLCDNTIAKRRCEGLAQGPGDEVPAGAGGGTAKPAPRGDYTSPVRCAGVEISRRRRSAGRLVAAQLARSGLPVSGLLHYQRGDVLGLEPPVAAGADAVLRYQALGAPPAQSIGMYVEHPTRLAYRQHRAQGPVLLRFRPALSGFAFHSLHRPSGTGARPWRHRRAHSPQINLPAPECTSSSAPCM